MDKHHLEWLFRFEPKQREEIKELLYRHKLALLKQVEAVDEMISFIQKPPPMR